MHDVVTRIKANNSRIWPIGLRSQLPIGANLSAYAETAVRFSYAIESPLSQWDVDKRRRKQMRAKLGYAPLIDMSKGVQREHIAPVEPDPISVEDFQERVQRKRDRAEQRERERAHAAALREHKKRSDRDAREAWEEYQNEQMRKIEEGQRRTEQQLAARAAELGVSSLTPYEYARSLQNAAFVVKETFNA